MNATTRLPQRPQSSLPHAAFGTRIRLRNLHAFDATERCLQGLKIRRIRTIHADVEARLLKLLFDIDLPSLHQRQPDKTRIHAICAVLMPRLPKSSACPVRVRATPNRHPPPRHCRSPAAAASLVLHRPQIRRVLAEPPAAHGTAHNTPAQYPTRNAPSTAARSGGSPASSAIHQQALLLHRESGHQQMRQAHAVEGRNRPVCGRALHRPSHHVLVHENLPCTPSSAAAIISLRCRA